MTADTSSFNSVASRGDTQYKGVSTNLTGESTPSAPVDIIVGSGVANNNARVGSMGSASTSSGPVLGVNDTSSFSGVASQGKVSDYISALLSNVRVGNAQAPIF